MLNSYLLGPPLRLRLFWRKTISGNDFTPHRVFGCAWKIEFSGKAFHLAVNIMALTLKLIYISIFTSNHFRTQMHRERERERKKRSLVLSLTLSSTLSLTPNAADPLPHAPQKISTLLRKSLLTHSHHSRQAQAEGRRELLPVKPRSSPWPTAPSVWSRRSNPSLIWLRHLSSSIVLKPISDDPGLIVLKPISDDPGLIVLAFASVAWSYLYIKPSRLSLFLLLSIWPNLMNFFFWVLFLLCFSV